MAVEKTYKAVVIGVSAGGLEALTLLLPTFKKDFPLPIFVVQHVGDDASGFLCSHLAARCQLKVIEPDDKQPIKPGVIYIAPSGYHMIVDSPQTISLSVDPRVNYSRPSIDLLFQSAAEAFQESLIGVVLTGANSDGTEGIKLIKKKQGLTIAQDPLTAEVAVMPQSAIDSGCIDRVLPLNEMAEFISMRALS
jgi:two-component system chemotaxis response regulator CheB